MPKITGSTSTGYEGLIVIMHSKLEPDVQYKGPLSGTKCETWKQQFRWAIHKIPT